MGTRLLDPENPGGFLPVPICAGSTGKYAWGSGRLVRFSPVPIPDNNNIIYNNNMENNNYLINNY